MSQAKIQHYVVIKEECQSAVKKTLLIKNHLHRRRYYRPSHNKAYNVARADCMAKQKPISHNE